MQKIAFKNFFLFFLMTCTGLLVYAQKIDCEHNQRYFINESVEAVIRTHELRIASENKLNAQGLQNEWNFSIIVGITSKTSNFYGGFDAAKTMVLEQFRMVNAAFNDPNVFNAQFNFNVESIYEFPDNVYDEIYFRHPDYDFKVIIDGFPLAGGGWYGSYRTIYHSWSVNNWNGPFAEYATDGLIHEFGHARGAIDLYALRVDGNKNQINGENYEIPFSSIMNYPYGIETWDEHSINLINLNAGNEISNLEFIHNSFPSKILFETKDQFEIPVNDVTINLYPVKWYSTALGLDPIITVSTDNHGKVELIENPYNPHEASSEPWKIDNCNFLIEARYSNIKLYKWLPLFEVQNHYFSTPLSSYTCSFTFPIASQFITIDAKGSEVGGEFAHFKVLVNNQEIGDSYTTSDYEPYRFPLSVDPSAILNIQIIFDNDTIIGEEDRDLYIYSIEYEDSLFVLEDMDVLYYDKQENELKYDNVMPWNGTLVIDFTTPDPPIASDISLCERDTIPVLVAVGKNIRWYQDAGLITLLHSGNNYKPRLIDAGIYHYFVTQTINGSESDPDTLTLTMKPLPDMPIGEDAIYCEGNVIGDLHALGNDIRWYGDIESTNLLSIGNNLKVESTAPGVYHYFPTQTISSCESDAATLTLTIHKKPSAPICNDVIVCEDDSLIALQASGDSIHWYDDNQLSNLVMIGNSYMPADISSGKYSFYIIQVISGCVGYVDSVKLTIKENPAAPQHTDVSVCFGEEVPALTADGKNINWYDDSILKNHLLSGNTLYSEHDQVGQYNYYVTQTLDACESKADTARLTIYPIPLFNLGQDTTITFDAKITLAVKDGFMNYLWNTGSQDHYIFVDGSSKGAGEYTFSLQVEDINYCIYSDTIKISVLLPTSLDNNMIEESIKIYPNPVLDRLHVHISNYPEGAWQFEIFDLSGKLQLSKPIYVKENYKHLDFDLSILHKGVYLIHFSSNNTPQIRKKLVIQ